MRQIGKVIKANSEQVTIQVLRESACGGNCKSCGSSCATGVTIEAPNEADTSVGDMVEIETETGAVLGVAALFYLVPLFAVVLGTIGVKSYFPDEVLGVSSDLVAIGAGAVLLALSLFAVRLATKGKTVKYKIRKLS